MPQPGVNTPHDGLSTKSKTQLLDEALNYVDEVAQLVGGEWLDAGCLPLFSALKTREAGPGYRATTEPPRVNTTSMCGNWPVRRPNSILMP